jgi:TolB-like protein/class 3 adenylate cyclase
VPDGASVERRLAAILAGDVVGYSRLMGVDEVGTLRALKAIRRELTDPAMAAHRGRVVKTTGDGILIEFASVVNAVACAIEIQRGMVSRNAAIANDKRIDFRIGINIGDIIIEDGDIFGDGVNVAARLEALCEPGGICLSRSARNQVRDKLPFVFNDLGEQDVKNITRPVRAFGLSRDDISALPDQEDLRPLAVASVPPAEPRSLALPDKPSIAVLPFQNMSGDPEQEYFADGMVEEIITALSRFRQLFVIARNSSFTYKGRAVDVKQVGRELGVRYVLEGSVRKAEKRVRISGQLIDTSIGTHLWADRFDGELDDIFDLQDQMTASVVGAIAPRLEEAEIERAKRKPTESLDAYDCYLRAMASYYQWTLEGTDETLRLCYQAIELEPSFASPYGLAARCHIWRKVYGRVANHDIAETARLARRAVELGKDDALVLAASGFALAFVVGDLDGGAALIDRALALNPNLAQAWHFSGFVRNYLGEPAVAIKHETQAMRLSPFDPLLARMFTATALALVLTDRYDEASSWAEKALQERPDDVPSLRVAAASHGLAGRIEPARQYLARLRQLDPTICTIGDIASRMPFRRGEHLAKVAEGLRRSGLPE